MHRYKKIYNKGNVLLNGLILKMIRICIYISLLQVFVRNHFIRTHINKPYKQTIVAKNAEMALLYR